LRNLEAVLNAGGADLGDVVRCGVYLADMGTFAEMDAAYREFFGDVPPARTTVGAELAGIGVEIDCVAAVDHP
jgi:2-iminobutanoate/2-iminopropanoate deaminase